MRELEKTDFPDRLRVWPNCPSKIWLSGNESLLYSEMIAVIGSRKPTREGALRAAKVSRLLTSRGACIVSGLAEGIDAIAHQTALKNGGRTVAVLGTPIDKFYPRTNESLQNEIRSRGLLVSQFPPGSKVTRGNFPKRNYLMASLSVGTVLVEASERSGTRYHVKAALTLGRPVAVLASQLRVGVPWISSLVESGQLSILGSVEDLLRFSAEILRFNSDQTPCIPNSPIVAIDPIPELPIAVSREIQKRPFYSKLLDFLLRRNH